MKIKVSWLMVSVLALIEPLSAKTSCIGQHKIVQLIRKNQNEFELYGRQYLITPKISWPKEKTLNLKPGEMDKNNTCSYELIGEPEESGFPSFIKLTRLPKTASSSCFSPKRLFKALSKGSKTVHYKNRNYIIDQSSLPMDKQIQMNQTELLVSLENAQRSEGGLEDGKRVTLCRYKVTQGNSQEVIGDVFVKRTYKSCFRPKDILNSLRAGASVLKYQKKDYTINQDALAGDRVEKGKCLNIGLNEGERTESIMEDGKIKVVCTYKAFKIQDQKNALGSIIVTRISQDTDSKPSPVTHILSKTQSNTR